jgi:hypothetical protein
MGEDEDLSLVSTSKQYYSYKLDPYTLAVNGLYTFELTVLDTVTLESSSNSVQVNVEPSDLVAVIRGGGTQAVLLGNSIILDASSSYDEDVAGLLCDTACAYSPCSFNVLHVTSVKHCSLLLSRPVASQNAPYITLQAALVWQAVYPTPGPALPSSLQCLTRVVSSCPATLNQLH